MKNKRMIICTLSFIFAFILFISIKPVEASVKYSLSSTGTLTISGTGTVSKTKYKSVTSTTKKIKKIVVKSGVTYIPAYAFQGCINCKEATVATSVKKVGQGCFSIKALEKLTIPGKFTFVSCSGDDAVNTVSSTNDDCALETVTFNTSLDVKTCTYFTTNNFVTYAKDSKYKSKDGIVYSKDLKELVRVPYKRTTLDIPEGTEDFDLWAVTYGYRYDEDFGEWTHIKDITIPTTMKTINDTHNVGQYESYDGAKSLCKTITVKSKQLTGKSISVLIDKFINISVDDIMEQIPECLYKDDNGFYTTYDDVFVYYNGTSETITVPENIKVVGLNVLGPEAKQSVKEVVLPEGLTEIMRYAFYCCDNTEKFNIPSTVTTIAKYAFYQTGWETMTVPQSVKSIGSYAFSNCPNSQKLYINCPVTSDIKTDMFKNNSKRFGYSEDLTVVYGSKVSKSTYFTAGYKTQVYKSSKTYYASCYWTKVSGITGYQVQYSKNSSYSSKTTITKKYSKDKYYANKVKLSSWKPAYIRIRTYYTSGSKTTYGKWITLS